MDESSEERRERQRTSDLYRPVLKRLRRCRSSVLRSRWIIPIGRKSRMSSPARSLTGDYPRAEDYLKSYREQTEETASPGLQADAHDGPQCGRTRTSAPPTRRRLTQSIAAAAAPADAVNEIQRYKALLDAGVLTEEEFAAKKRQLLGI